MTFSLTTTVKLNIYVTSGILSTIYLFSSSRLILIGNESEDYVGFIFSKTIIARELS